MKSDTPIFSLVFLTWNAEDCIVKTLNSLTKQTYKDFEIIIVDNGSEDDTIAIVREYNSQLQLTIIENGENLGFSEGINCGISETSGEYICCYNHDTYFPEDYLETIVNYISSNSVWTTARLNFRTSKQHKCVRLLGKDRFPIPYMVDRLEGVAEVNYVPGDGLIVPREVYSQLTSGIFDPALPPKGEDVDLSLRLNNENIPMKAILDTYSVHPDEGQYDVSSKTIREHFDNVWARSLAYQRNGLTIIDIVYLIVSLVTVPSRILIGEFPRKEEKFPCNIINY